MAQVTPPDPTADRGWVQWWYDTDLSDAEDEFNAARRNEEVQKGLTPGILGNLSLPTDYLSKSAAEQAWIILIAERQARDGVNYPGTGIVTGMIPEGVESTLSGVSQGHADDMQANDFFSHTSSTGQSAGSRITSAFLGCYQGWGENIAWNSVSGGGYTLGVLLAFYNFIYDDGACCNWGHRHLCLKQTGNNDYGDPDRIGVFGFARSTGSNGDYFVMDYVDPKNGCTYNINDYGAGSGGSCPSHIDVDGSIASGSYQATSTVASTGTVGSSTDVEFMAATSISLDNNFQTMLGGELTILIQSCTTAAHSRSKQDNSAAEVVRISPLLEQQHFVGGKPTFKMGRK